MKLFYHTHRTGLYKESTLISVAFVAENGTYFYAELNDYDRSQVDDWILQNVIGNLKYPNYTDTICIVEPLLVGPRSMEVVGSKEGVRKLFFQWLEQFGEDVKVEWVGDVTHFSFVHVVDLLFGNGLDIPTSKFCMATHDINQDLAFYTNDEIEASDLNRAQLIKNFKLPAVEGCRFNALYDARTVKVLYEYMKDRGIV